MVTDICKDRHKACETYTGFRTANKETVVAVLHNPAYLSFTDVVHHGDTSQIPCAGRGRKPASLPSAVQAACCALPFLRE